MSISYLRSSLAMMAVLLGGLVESSALWSCRVLIFQVANFRLTFFLNFLPHVDVARMPAVRH